MLLREILETFQLRFKVDNDLETVKLDIPFDGKITVGRMDRLNNNVCDSNEVDCWKGIYKRPGTVFVEVKYLYNSIQPLRCNCTNSMLKYSSHSYTKDGISYSAMLIKELNKQSNVAKLVVFICEKRSGKSKK